MKKAMSVSTTTVMFIVIGVIIVAIVIHFGPQITEMIKEALSMKHPKFV